VVKAVVAGTMTGISSVVADPAHALQVSANFVPDLNTAAGTKAAQATLAATAKLWTTATGKVDPTLDTQQWTAMADFMAQQKLTATRQDPNLAMSNAFH
jgi:NitT/TauT family transport system substrate-binding protein